MLNRFIRHFSSINLRQKSEFFHKNGYAVLENYMTHEQVDSLKD